MMIHEAKKLKVLIAAGGTGGHVFPGIAIAEEMKRFDPSVLISFAGTERGLEADIVPKHGWRVAMIPSHSIKDRKGLAKIAAVLMIPLSVVRAMGILISSRPDVLVSIGGYAAGPLCLAAWMLRVPVALVEPNAIPGMTNRMLSRFAEKIFVAFSRAKEAFGAKAILTGTPVRRMVLEARHGEKPASERMTVLVFGGSQGARTLNRGIVAALPSLAPFREKLYFIHQTGAGDDRSAIGRAYNDAGIEANVFPFSDRMWECYENADLVVARSGANTVAEVAALGIPSVLVPYPYAADDHQRANAEALVRAGGAVMIDDRDFTGDRIAKEIVSMMNDRSRLEAMRRGALGFGRPDAARSIAKECLAIASGE